jgi:hypothetical protein
VDTNGGATKGRVSIRPFVAESAKAMRYHGRNFLHALKAARIAGNAATKTVVCTWRVFR